MSKTSFFTQLATIGLSQVALEIRLADDGSMTVFVTPKSDKAKDNDAFKIIQPFTLTASPEDLDNDFFATVTEPLAEAGKIVTNIENFKAKLDEAKKATEKTTKTSEKLEAVAPKISKEEQAKIDKLAKAENAVKEQIALCTNYTSFGKNKAKLKKAIDALSVLSTSTLESQLLEPAQEFFEANNAIMDGSFVAPKLETVISTPVKTEKTDVAEAPAAPTMDVKVVIEQPEEIIDPVDKEMKLRFHNRVAELIGLGYTNTGDEYTHNDPAPNFNRIFDFKEIETLPEEDWKTAMDFIRNPEIDEEPEAEGQSLSTMQTDRTEERKSQLRSLGLEETAKGFEGHDFEVKLTTIENHTAEYWNELISGIQKIVSADNSTTDGPVSPASPEAPIDFEARIKERTDRLLGLGMVGDGGMNLVGHTFTVHIGQMKDDTDEQFEKLFDNIAFVSKTPIADKVFEDRMNFRKEKLIEAGFMFDGVKDDYTNYKSSITTDQMMGLSDADFDKYVKQSQELAQRKVRTDNRIIELISYGFQDANNTGEYANTNPKVITKFTAQDIETASDTDWNTAIALVVNLLNEKEAVPAAPMNVVKDDEMVLVMKPGQLYTEQQYIDAGWNREQLVAQGHAMWVYKDTLANPNVSVPAAPAAPASLLGANDSLID